MPQTQDQPDTVDAGLADAPNSLTAATVYGRRSRWLLFIVNCGALVYNINQTAYRQLLCPPEILGRVNATIRFLLWVTLPTGGLLGGTLGNYLSNREAS